MLGTHDLAAELRVRLSMTGLALGRMELVEKEVAKLPPPATTVLTKARPWSVSCGTASAPDHRQGVVNERVTQGRPSQPP